MTTAQRKAFGVLATAVLATSVMAAPTNPEYTWNGGASGTWNASNTNWLDSTSASVAWNSATATNARLTTDDASITVAAALTVGALEFSAARNTLSATSARTVTLSRDATLNGTYRGSISVTGSATIGDYVTLGSSGGNGMFLIGGTLNLSSSAPGTKPGGAIKFDYGPFAIQQGATVNVLPGATISVATGAGTSGQIELGDISAAAAAGNNNTLNVSGGTVATGGALEIGRSGSTNGTLNLNSGSVSAASLTLYNSGTIADSSTVNLGGGTLTVASLARGSSGSGNTVVNFDGGTLRPSASSTTFWANVFTAANVKAGGAKIDTQAFNITVAQPLVHYSGLAGDDGGLTKSGSGTLTLSGANTYTGATTVTGGTVALTGSVSSTKLNVVSGTFDAGAVASMPNLTSLAGGGSVTAPSGGLVLGSAGTLSPGGMTSVAGDQAGTLTLAGDLSLAQGSRFIFDLGDTSDLVSMAASTLTLDGQQFSDFTFNAPVGGYADGTRYVLFDAGAINGSLGAPASLSGSLGDGAMGLLAVDGNDLVMTVSIPEPSALALLGAATLGLIPNRRRRESSR